MTSNNNESGKRQTNDWRINSSSSAEAAMGDGLAASGVDIPKG